MAKFKSGLGNDDEVSDEIFLIRFRHWRNQELSQTDWTQLIDSPVDKDIWAQYRQLLRDLPNVNKNIREIDLPERP